MGVTIALFAAFAVAAYSWRHVFGAQVGVTAVLLLGVFALLAAVILSGILGATGIVKTATTKIGGGAAIFVVVLGALVSAALKLQPHSSNVRVLVKGLRAAETARVSVVGGCSADAVGPIGETSIALGEPCDRDPLHFSIEVPGNAPYEQDVPRSKAENAIELQWKRQALQRAITGTIHSAPNLLAHGGRVMLVGCPAAKAADIDANNGGFALPIPEDCAAMHPKFKLAIIDEKGREFEMHADDYAENELTLETPPAPVDAQPRTPLCRIDRDYWVIRKCAHPVESTAPNALELKRLQSEFPQCDRFVIEKCG